MTDMLAKDFMTKDVVTVEIPSSRDDVLRILKRTGISGVPVVKGEEKKLLGIVTRKDILIKPEETQIALLMTSDPLTIEPDTDIAEDPNEICGNAIIPDNNAHKRNSPELRICKSRPFLQSI